MTLICDASLRADTVDSLGLRPPARHRERIAQRLRIGAKAPEMSCPGGDRAIGNQRAAVFD